MKKELLIKNFNAQRKEMHLVLANYPNIRGNAKVAADALVLHWTDVFLSYYGTRNDEERANLFVPLMESLMVEYLDSFADNTEFAQVYALVAQPVVRAFNLKQKVMNVTEPWMREPVIRVCDYLFHPEFKADYQNKPFNMDPSSKVEEEFLSYFAKEKDTINEYRETVKHLASTK